MNLRFHTLFATLFLILGAGIAASLAQVSSEDKVRAPEPSANYQLKASNASQVDSDISWWEARTKASPGNSASWLGLYKAQRYLALRDRGKTFTPAQKNKLSNIERTLEAIDPDSYEYHRVAFLNRYMTESGKSHLEAAYQLRPDDAENWDALAAYALFEGRNTDFKSYLSLLKAANVFSPALLDYHRELLKGLPKNAVLLAHGYADTWPLLMLQQLENQRKDVQVVSLDHLLNKSYREKIMQVLGVSASVQLPDEPYLAAELLPAGTVRPVHVCLSFPSFWLSGHTRNLYFEGLSYRWLPEMTTFRQFSSSKYLESTVKLSAIRPQEPVSRNYLPLLTEAYREYKAQQNPQKAELVKQKALSIIAVIGNPPTLIEKFE